MRVAVTGGAGFIGHHICRALMDTINFVPVVIDDLQAGVNYTPPGVELRKVNLRYVTELDIQDCDAVIHCAARADVSRNWFSEGERRHLYDENIEATIRLLEAMRRPVPIVFLSTCAVYGDTAVGQAHEETETCFATSPYAASKLAGESLIQAYAFARESSWYALRLSCVVGEGLHHGHAADFVRMAREGVIRARNDGRVKKSFVHARDVAGAAVRMLASDMVSGIYNVAARPWSWRDTVRVMEEVGGAPIPVDAPDRVHGWIGDPMAVASGEKLREFYQLRYSVEDGVRESLASLGWGPQ